MCVVAGAVFPHQLQVTLPLDSVSHNQAHELVAARTYTWACVPNADLAYVEPSKVRDYLLSPSHAVGRFKSIVFTALGYAQENWPLLRDDLLMLARTREAVIGQNSVYGQKYEVSGQLIGPNGRSDKPE